MTRPTRLLISIMSMVLACARSERLTVNVPATQCCIFTCADDLLLVDEWGEGDEFGFSADELHSDVRERGRDGARDTGQSYGDLA